MKKPGTAMGLIGFAVGGLAVCYWEMRPSPQSASATPLGPSAAPVAQRPPPPAVAPGAYGGKKSNAAAHAAGTAGRVEKAGRAVSTGERNGDGVSVQTARGVNTAGGTANERPVGDRSPGGMAVGDRSPGGMATGDRSPGGMATGDRSLGGGEVGRGATGSRGGGPRGWSGAPASRAPAASSEPRPSGRAADRLTRFEDRNPQSTDRGSAATRPLATAGDVRIHRVLVGGQVLDAGVVSQAVFREHDRGDRYLVYFDVDVDAPGVHYDDFRLEDGKGLIYEPIPTHDALGTRNADGMSRGGLAFAIYNDAAPARLLRRSGPDSYAALPQSVFQPRR